MTGPERSTPPGAQFAILGMAQMYFGREFSNTDAGFEAAIKALDEQHVRVQPPVPDKLRITEVVRDEHPVIDIAEQMADMGIALEDYELALTAANHLYAFGDVDYQDFLGGRAFNAALQVHRRFYDLVNERFSDVDPYLRGAGQIMSADIADMQAQGKLYEELRLRRAVIHMLAFNGTLGDAARALFDPFAVIHKV